MASILNESETLLFLANGGKSSGVVVVVVDETSCHLVSDFFLVLHVMTNKHDCSSEQP